MMRPLCTIGNETIDLYFDYRNHFRRSGASEFGSHWLKIISKTKILTCRV